MRRPAAGAALATVMAGVLVTWGCGTAESPNAPVPVPPGTDGLAVSAYIAGSQPDQIRDVAIDGQGNIYLTGGTVSRDYPSTAGVIQPAHDPGPPASSRIAQDYDVVVTKLDPSGRVIWSTFLGGPGHDRAYGIEVDSQGFVYIGGRAGVGFPVTSGAAQGFVGGPDKAPYGRQDGFICKLNPTATQIVFCTYLGASDGLIIRDIAVDASGSVYAIGGHESGSFPAAVADAFTNGRLGGPDAFLAKLASDGSRVLWATYLGGSGKDGNQGSVRLDGSGVPYALFTTDSQNAFTSAGAYQPMLRGDSDLYVARLDPMSGGVVAATYLGGSLNESTETHEFAVGASGDVYVAAPTKSLDFPTTPGAFQTAYGGGVNDAFVAHLSPDLATLVASTYFGGSANDRPEGVAVGSDGALYFTGVSGSPDFPSTSDAFQPTVRGSSDAIFVKLSPGLNEVLYATLIGGSALDGGRGAAVDASGDFYMIGSTESGDWPTTGGGGGTGVGGMGDGFIAVFRNR
ncbi:MAG: SBBP repeat-containing protein [Gemmatimonadota bacterium]